MNDFLTYNEKSDSRYVHWEASLVHNNLIEEQQITPLSVKRCTNEEYESFYPPDRYSS